MKLGTRVALAVGVGYVLGRRRKLRSALTLAAAVAAGRASHNAPNLIKYGTDLLSSSEAFNNLKTMSKPLTTAGKAAATAAIGSGVDALSERIRDKTDALRGLAPEPPESEDRPARKGRKADEREEPDDREELADEADEGDYDEEDVEEADADEEPDERDENEGGGRSARARERVSAGRQAASSTTRRRR